MPKSQKTTNKASKKVSFAITPKNFLNLLQLSIYHPNQYSEAIPLSGGKKEPLFFFILTSVLGSILSLLTDVVIKQKPEVLFLGISSIVFSIPLIILSLFIIAGILHLIAKALSGRGQFNSTLRAVSYSSILSIFSFIPLVSILTGVLMLYILAKALSRTHGFSLSRATITVITPFLLALVIMVMLGLAGIVSLFNLGRSINIPGLI